MQPLELTFYTYLINFLYYFAYVLLFASFIVLYVRAYRAPGINDFVTFTAFMLIGFITLVLIDAMGRGQMEDILPFRLLEVVLGNSGVYPYVSAFVLLFFLYAGYNLFKQNNIRLLLAVWLVLNFVNVGELLWNAYKYATWLPPVKPHSLSFPKNILIDHLMVRRSYYLERMIYPACWIILCCLSGLKISKERLTHGNNHKP